MIDDPTVITIWVPQTVGIVALTWTPAPVVIPHQEIVTEGGVILVTENGDPIVS